jgi:integrase
VNKNIVPLLGQAKVSKLSAIQITQAYTKALESGRRDGKGGLSPRTVNHMHRILTQALDDASRWRLLVRNPAKGIKPPMVSPKPMQTYDLSQTATLIEAMRPTRMFMPTILAVLCGLRRGEIAALRWKNVDLAAGLLPSLKAPSRRKLVFATKNRSPTSQSVMCGCLKRLSRN